MDTAPTTAKRIFLIRHARPRVSRKGLFDAAAARQYISDYDAAQVEEFVMAHEGIPYQAVEKVYCSTLVRSQLTAKAIFGEQAELRVDPTFREFERRIFTLPLLRLPIRLWLLSARLLWFLGLNSRGIETFRQARTRARRAAEVLAQDAQEHHTTVLVAHGLLNNFIRRELKALGWQESSKGGHGFLSVQVLSQE
ncbi:histidine phosphatase family protein [Pontibacter actiniarum]|uniref:Histidine phosphatase family protein n=1 Tax=Pontibacter actiniarum TaxID=323450 RepID=A0A1X9YTH2_9BACT|nr:phosphoglycerate mutase family protein [Pontibacter actiniarum]ARS36121.1 histidine phosphatase family protein [Pontibacter actiniarum]